MTRAIAVKLTLIRVLLLSSTRSVSVLFSDEVETTVPWIPPAVTTRSFFFNVDNILGRSTLFSQNADHESSQFGCDWSDTKVDFSKQKHVLYAISGIM